MNPIVWLLPSRLAQSNAKRLYGIIVAQARLPIFYAEIGMPDSLDGRYLMLSLHLFVVLHRLKREGPQARPAAQELVDLFTRDMDTVLREVGIGDLRIAKHVRGLCASNHGLILQLESAVNADDPDRLEQILTDALPTDCPQPQAVAQALSIYLQEAISTLAAQPFRRLSAGSLQFPSLAARV